MAPVTVQLIAPRSRPLRNRHIKKRLLPTPHTDDGIPAPATPLLPPRRTAEESIEFRTVDKRMVNVTHVLAPPKPRAASSSEAPPSYDNKQCNTKLNGR